MTIHCSTEEQFYDAVLVLVTRGLTFEADAHRLNITLTVGF